MIIEIYLFKFDAKFIKYSIEKTKGSTINIISNHNFVSRCEKREKNRRHRCHTRTIEKSIVSSFQTSESFCCLCKIRVITSTVVIFFILARSLLNISCGQVQRWYNSACCRVGGLSYMDRLCCKFHEYIFLNKENPLLVSAHIMMI